MRSSLALAGVLLAGGDRHGTASCRSSLALAGVLLVDGASAQTPAPAPSTSAAEVRAAMGIPSTAEVRGQRDAVGFASTAAQMAAVWEKSGPLLPEERLQPPPAAGVVGAVCAHDDYLYAGRVYKVVLPETAP